MTDNDDNAQGTAGGITSGNSGHAAVMLIVSGPGFTAVDNPGRGFFYVSFEALDAGVFQRVKPTLVISTLVGVGFDAVEIARRLHRLGYAGQYRAVALSLPDVGLIECEVEAVAPGLNFDVVQIAPG